MLARFLIFSPSHNASANDAQSISVNMNLRDVSYSSVETAQFVPPGYEGSIRFTPSFDCFEGTINGDEGCEVGKWEGRGLRVCVPRWRRGNETEGRVVVGRAEVAVKASSGAGRVGGGWVGVVGVVVSVVGGVGGVF